MKRLSLLLILLAGFTSCDPKKSSVRTNTLATPISGNVSGFGLTNQCPQGMSNIGAIYDNGQSLGFSGTFEDAVKSLLSATILPSDIGTISSGMNDTTGVRFAGTIKLDAAGNVVQASSKLQIQIYDSIWYNNRVTNPSEQAIPLQFDPASGATISGQFAPTTGTGYFIVKDSYGEIRFDGTYNAQNFSGTVSFRNYSNVTGAAAASGSLGQFLINTCGIVQK